MICFIGPPGIGKGYYISKIKEVYNINVFGFGEYLRDQVKLETDFGIKIKSIIDKGEIVSCDLLFNNLESDIFRSHNLILDGFPRGMQQSEFFFEFCKKEDLSIDYIIEFFVNDIDILYQRIAQRRLLNRLDDNIEVIKNRIEKYYSENLKIREFFIKNNVNYNLIDASFKNDVVFNNFIKIINDWLIKV